MENSYLIIFCSKAIIYGTHGAQMDQIMLFTMSRRMDGWKQSYFQNGFTLSSWRFLSNLVWGAAKSARGLFKASRGLYGLLGACKGALEALKAPWGL